MTDKLGFTLIELLIVVSIMALLTVFGLLGFQNFNKSQSLKIAAGELKANLRFAQNSALSGVASTISCSDVTRAGGLFKGYQAIFTQGDKTYKIVEKCGTPTGSGVIDGVLRTYTLPNIDGITIGSVNPFANSSPTCGGNLCILFAPVNQGVQFVPDPGESTSNATVTLHGAASGDYQIVVTKTGNIYETK